MMHQNGYELEHSGGVGGVVASRILGILSGHLIDTLYLTIRNEYIPIFICYFQIPLCSLTNSFPALWKTLRSPSEQEP